MENPNPSETTLAEMSSKVRAFPCISCGAKLSFAPGSKTLKCPYCGTSNAIPESDDDVEELDLDAWLTQLQAEHETHEQEQIKCRNCGGEQTLPANLFAGNCTFCGSPITSKSYARRQIKPKSLVPFQITRQQAQQKWRDWIKGLWLAPSALKKFAQGDAGIKGIYVPYWTYDASTWTEYLGQRGEDYEESYDTTNSNGERVRQTRTQTRWFPVSGTVSFFHDDVLVAASKTAWGAATPKGGSIPILSAFNAGNLRKWNTRALVPYQEEYIAGFQAEAYQVGLKEGFIEAKQIIDNKVQQLVYADIGGDHQRIGSLDTQYSHLTFKHILLPMWVSAYLFGGKAYRFVVNGQSGEVQGESPKSGWKVFFLVMGILALLFLFLVVSGKHG
jgi:LSD1 subclass zinc finger protein